LLLNLLEKKQNLNVLDIACGSGYLLNLCYKRFGKKLKLTGVDMSSSELELARKKLNHTNYKLHLGMAQDLSFLEDSSFDAILCHWALTLMDPIAPVLNNINRLLKNNGFFAAIIDGDMDAVPEYRKIHNIIYKYVQKEHPNYGTIELGDVRVRNSKDLKKLALKTFSNSKVTITPHVLYFSDYPRTLAREVARFFYAAFVLSNKGHSKMLKELEKYFSSRLNKGLGSYMMPINLLYIKKN
jgi:ubiquinone/menaquinone biosynthesis C-methylase UbiE